MIKNDILITVVDGQGGGIGRQYIESLRKQLPKDLPVIIRALGTNAAATSNMMQAGATDGATGENAIVTNCLLYTSPSPRDGLLSRMPSSA